MRAPITPSSLKWLINRRARLDGELEKLKEAEDRRSDDARRPIEHARAVLKDLEDQDEMMRRVFERTRSALSQDINATDQLLRQHEIPVDPALIKRIRSQDNLSLTDFGHLTRLIYSFLRMANGKPCNATQVAAYVADSLGMDGEESYFSDLRYRVRKRMQHLAWEGKITRIECQQGSVEGRWCLKPSQIANSEQETHLHGDDLANSRATTAKLRN